MTVRFWTIVEAPLGSGDRGHAESAVLSALDPRTMVPAGIWHVCLGGGGDRQFTAVTAAVDAADVAEASTKLNRHVLPALEQAGFDIARGIIRIAPYETWERAYEPERKDGPMYGPGDYTFNTADWIE
ncbi:MAG: hypothetical protein ACRDOO_28625 [Actinomadura sp.]